MPEPHRRRDHYTVLGVPPSASARQITSAYRRLVRSLHPDTSPAGPSAQEDLAEVVAAYDALRDPERRAAYDADRERPAGQALPGRAVPVRLTHRPPGAFDAFGRPAAPEPPPAPLRVGPVHVAPETVSGIPLTRYDRPVGDLFDRMLAWLWEDDPLWPL